MRRIRSNGGRVIVEVGDGLDGCFGGLGIRGGRGVCSD